MFVESAVNTFFCIYKKQKENIFILANIKIIS